MYTVASSYNSHSISKATTLERVLCLGTEQTVTILLLLDTWTSSYAFYPFLYSHGGLYLQQTGKLGKEESMHASKGSFGGHHNENKHYAGLCGH